LKGTGVVAGLAPPEAPLTGQSWDTYLRFSLNRWLPKWALRSIIDVGLLNAARNPDQTKWRKVINDGIVKSMTPEDQAMIGEKEKEAMVSELRDAGFNSGAVGIVHEAKMFLGKWRFELKNIEGKVHFWNGTENVDIPVGMARWMAEQVPDSRLKEYPGLMHFSVFHLKSEEILRDLIEM
jgi:pimeloyl-ACP methyl ester carboxylesterase